MKIQLNRNEDRLTVNKVTIFNGDSEFEIELSKFGEIIIRKEQYGEGESAVIIKPKVSNEIGIS
jgi:hypothetical protein